MLYSWLIQRDSPRDASRSSNKALLSVSLALSCSLFCLFVFSRVLLGALQSNPLGPSLPPQPFEDASETFSQTFGPVSVADVSNE